jgi:hypothetical protein
MKTSIRGFLPRALFVAGATVLGSAMLPVATAEAASSRTHMASDCQFESANSVVQGAFDQGFLTNQTTNVASIICPLATQTTTKTLKVTVFYVSKLSLPPNGSARPIFVHCTLRSRNPVTLSEISADKVVEMAKKNTLQAVADKFLLSINGSLYKGNTMECLMDAQTKYARYEIVAYQVDES